MAVRRAVFAFLSLAGALLCRAAEEDNWGYGGQGFHNLRVADLFGDWREELLLRRKDNRAIRVYLTPEPTRYRFHTFMEDPIYRWSVATQNNGYNVPAEPGFYFGPELLGSDAMFRGTRLSKQEK